MRGFPQMLRRTRRRFGERLMIRHRLELPTGGTPHERVQAAQLPGFVRIGLERCRQFVSAGIGRIEVRARALGPHRRKQWRVPVEPVPWPIIHFHQAPEGRVLDGHQQRIPVAVRLLPEDFIHLLSGLDQDRNHAPLIFGERTQIGRQPKRGVLLEPTRRVGHRITTSDRCRSDDDRERKNIFAHGSTQSSGIVRSTALSI